MKNFVKLFMVASLVLIQSTSVYAAEKMITTAGSSTVRPIVEKAAKTFRRNHPSVKFVIGGGGSSHGVKSAGEGTASSKRIADIINTVNEIAFQTNLLALNAAVEAARAGEQGRGFAVVAGEVRNLAGRSAEAAKEIQTLINDSVEKIEGGNKLVEETGETLKNIIDGVQNVAQTISEISSASQEQASGIDQVNKAIAQMDEVVQQNASLVEEAAATSENLSGEADGMQRLMATFKVNMSDIKREERTKEKHSLKTDKERVNIAAAQTAAAGKQKGADTMEEFAEF